MAPCAPSRAGALGGGPGRAWRSPHFKSPPSPATPAASGPPPALGGDGGGSGDACDASPNASRGRSERCLSATLWTPWWGAEAARFGGSAANRARIPCAWSPPWGFPRCGRHPGDVHRCGRRRGGVARLPDRPRVSGMVRDGRSCIQWSEFRSAPTGIQGLVRRPEGGPHLRANDSQDLPDRRSESSTAAELEGDCVLCALGCRRTGNGKGGRRSAVAARALLRLPAPDARRATGVKTPSG